MCTSALIGFNFTMYPLNAVHPVVRASAWQRLTTAPPTSFGLEESRICDQPCVCQRVAQEIPWNC